MPMVSKTAFETSMHLAIQRRQRIPELRFLVNHGRLRFYRIRFI